MCFYPTTCILLSCLFAYDAQLPLFPCSSPRLHATCALGREIVSKNPSAKSVKEKVDKLQAEEAAIDTAWDNRQRQLQDAYNLQVSNLSLLSIIYQSNCLIDSFSFNSHLLNYLS